MTPKTLYTYCAGDQIDVDTEIHRIQHCGGRNIRIEKRTETIRLISFEVDDPKDYFRKLFDILT